MFQHQHQLRLIGESELFIFFWVIDRKHTVALKKTYIIVQRNHINKLKKYNNTRPIKWIPNQEIQKI